MEVAHVQRPDVITSDVALLEGTGPQAVDTILSENGPIPVIYITSAPDLCASCASLMRVFSKPLHRPSIAAAFRELAFPLDRQPEI